LDGLQGASACRKQTKIELWYQMLAFCEIAGMIYLGWAHVPLVFENLIYASLGSRTASG